VFMGRNKLILLTIVNDHSIFFGKRSQRGKAASALLSGT
jgi:hypothetical protein